MQTSPQSSRAGQKLASPSTHMVCALGSHPSVQSCCSRSEGNVNGTDLTIFLVSDCHGHGKSEPHAAEDRFLIWDFNHVVSQSGYRSCIEALAVHHSGLKAARQSAGR